MSGSRSRRKGHQFERDVANMFKAVGYPQAQRQLEYQLNQCQGVDLAGTGPYRVQCKKLKSYASVNTITEIKDTTGVPVLITAADRLEPMVVLPLKDFLQLIKVESGLTLDDDFNSIESCSNEQKSKNENLPLKPDTLKTLKTKKKS